MLRLPMEGYSGGLLARSTSGGSVSTALSSTAKMAVSEAQGTRLSAKGVLDASRRSALLLGEESRSVTSVEAAAAVRSIRESMVSASASSESADPPSRAPKREREGE
jgi:hypothetical protein